MMEKEEAPPELTHLFAFDYQHNIRSTSELMLPSGHAGMIVFTRLAHMNTSTMSLLSVGNDSMSWKSQLNNQGEANRS